MDQNQNKELPLNVIAVCVEINDVSWQLIFRRTEDMDTHIIIYVN